MKSIHYNLIEMVVVAKIIIWRERSTIFFFPVEIPRLNCSGKNESTKMYGSWFKRHQVSERQQGKMSRITWHGFWQL